MKKTILGLLQYGFFLGMGIFLVWWSLHQIPEQEWEDFQQSLRSAKYWLILPVFLILTSSHIIRSLRWRLLMEPMGYSPTFLNTFFAVMIGYLANLAVPRLGEVLKCTLLTKYENVPAEKVLGTIIAERAFDLICLLFVFLLAGLLQFDVVKKSYLNIVAFKANNANSSENVSIWIAIIVIMFVLITLGWIFYTGRSKALINKFIKLAKGIFEGLLSARNLKQKKLFFLYTFSIWALYVFGTWLGLYATEGTDHLNLPVAVTSMAFASIGMILTPGGIGAYAFLLAKVLEQNGIDYTLGVANGTLQWFAQVLIVVVVGGISLLVLPFCNKTRSNEGN